MSGKRGSRDAVGDESAAASKRLCHSVGPAENSVEARATAVTLVQSLRRQLREAETALDALIPNALGAVDDGSARDDGNAAHDDGGSADGGDSAARDDDAADDDADGAARAAPTTRLATTTRSPVFIRMGPPNGAHVGGRR